MMCEVLSGIYGNDLFLIALNLGVSIKVGKDPSALKVFSDLVLISPLFNCPSYTSLSKNKTKSRWIGPMIYKAVYPRHMSHLSVRFYCINTTPISQVDKLASCISYFSLGYDKNI